MNPDEVRRWQERLKSMSPDELRDWLAKAQARTRSASVSSSSDNTDQPSIEVYRPPAGSIVKKIKYVPYVEKTSRTGGASWRRQGSALNEHSERLGLVKCPSCDGHQLRRMYKPSVWGYKLWCYECGWRDTIPTVKEDEQL